MAAPPRRLLVLLNPHAGGGAAARAWRAAEPVLSAAGCASTVRASAARGEVARIVAAADASAHDALVVVGGDGSVHEAVAGLATRADGWRPPLGIVPAGSGNALAHDLLCLDPREAAARIARGARRRIDLLRARVGDRTLWSPNVVGWALAADVAARAEAWRALGRFRYTPATLHEIARGRARAGTLVIDGERHEGPFALVLAGNTQHTGRGMRLLPQARLDDGRLDVLALRPAGRLALVRRFLALGRRPPGADATTIVATARTLVLETPALERLNVDGELVDAAGATRLEIEVVPGALELLA